MVAPRPGSLAAAAEKARIPDAFRPGPAHASAGPRQIRNLCRTEPGPRPSAHPAARHGGGRTGLSRPDAGLRPAHGAARPQAGVLLADAPDPLRPVRHRCLRLPGILSRVALVPA